MQNYKVKASAPPPPAAAAAPAETDAPPETSATPPPPGATPPTPTPSTPASTSGGRVVASPLAHMLAKDMGYDIASIPGTGPGGRVIAADVKEFVPSAAAAATTEPTATTTTASAPAPAQAAMAAPTAPPVAGAGYTDYPLSESAKEIAAALTHSKQNVPHYYLTVDISMDALLTNAMPP